MTQSVQRENELHLRAETNDFVGDNEIIFVLKLLEGIVKHLFADWLNKTNKSKLSVLQYLYENQHLKYQTALHYLKHNLCTIKIDFKYTNKINLNPLKKNSFAKL